MPRSLLSIASFLALALTVVPTPAAERAPDPRPSGAAIDRQILAEVKERSELMKNLQYMSDVIGGRLTGSKSLERANNWTADKMKAYGLVNVHLEPWEIPVGWERGKATMKIVEPDNGRELLIASFGWTPGTKGKRTGEVIVLKARKKDDLAVYKGKIKDATILLSPPKEVKPITDLTYPAPPGPVVAPPPVPKKESGSRNQESGIRDRESGSQRDKTEFVVADTRTLTPESGLPITDSRLLIEERQPGFEEVTEFLKAEGAACVVIDAGKPHGLLVTTGGWPSDRAVAEARLPRVFMAHEHYALLYRLATRPDAVTKVELDIDNKFLPGPITVYNTVGEVTGSEKPDEFVLIGAHLDSWELASGTTDNATGSCVVLEVARTVAALAKAGQRPKRTIRFVLFTGEEQGLHGSRKYVERHKDEMDRHSAALVHDTGTGKVYGLGMHGRTSVKDVLEPQLGSLAQLEGWKGLDMRGTGGTDHLSFHAVGVPGFACLQDIDEYRLTHHTQSDTFDKAKEPNLIQGAQVLTVTLMRIANLPELLPRK